MEILELSSMTDETELKTYVGLLICGVFKSGHENALFLFQVGGIGRDNIWSHNEP